MFICLVSAPFGTITEFDEGNEQDDSHDEDISQEIQNNLVNMKGWFTENQGQIENSDVKFLYAASDLSIGFIVSGYLIKLTNEKNFTSVVKVTFEGANQATPEGKGDLPHKNNYFRGKDSLKWKIGISNFEKIIYPNLYDGIDLQFYLNENGLKYDFIVHSLADHKKIRIIVEGHNDLFINEKEDLVISSFFGPEYGILDSNLLVYYADDSHDNIQSQFSILDNDTYTFNLEDRDLNRPIIIDPLIYSTLLGGSDKDGTCGIVVDSSGYSYISGWSHSTDFPTTPGAYDNTNNGNMDAFVVKLNPDGSDLVYSTYIGGSENDRCYGGLAVDGSGYSYITGWTASSDFPTTEGAYDTSQNGNRDAFVLKLNPDGSDLTFSTFLGGSDNDWGYGGILIDSSGNSIITGATISSDFPTTAGAYDRNYNDGSDVIVVKLNPDGSDLVFSTYIGGNQADTAYSIIQDSSGNTFIVGETNSPNFPTTDNAYDRTPNGLFDAFVFELNHDGSDLVYSTFIGGISDEYGYNIAKDASGNIYITGVTGSTNFPTTDGAYDTTGDVDGDCFVTKLNSDGSDLVYSTFIGGSDYDGGYAIVENGNGNIYITGSTDSPDFPTTPDAFDDTLSGDEDVIFVMLNPDGSELVYSTYIGGSQDNVWGESGSCLAIDSSGFSHITGHTSAPDFPTTPEAYDTTPNGDWGGFVLMLDMFPDDNNGNEDHQEGDDNRWYNAPLYLSFTIILVFAVVIVVIVLFIRYRNEDFYHEWDEIEDSNEEL